MSDSWFASKIAPSGDTNDNEGGCDPKEARALKAYLHHKTTASEAARAITRPVSNAAKPADELHRLWGLIQEAFMELLHEHTTPLIALMQAIEDLPNPVAIPNESRHPDDGFWKESPGFANLWSDMYPRYCFRANVDGSAGELREAMKIDHTRQAHIEAQLFHADLAGLTIHWGYEVVADALETSDAIFDFEVPAAVQWIVVCGKRFLEGARKKELSRALQRRGKTLRDLWKVDDATVMTLGRWGFWKERLRGFQWDPELVRDVRRAFNAMEEMESEIAL